MPNFWIFFNKSCFLFLTGYTFAIPGNGNKNCYQYDVENNKWTKYLALQFSHLTGSGTVYQSKLYIFDNPYSEAIDLITKTVAESIPTPNATEKGACTVLLEDSVLVIGGILSRYHKDIISAMYNSILSTHLPSLQLSNLLYVVTCACPLFPVNFQYKMASK